ILRYGEDISASSPRKLCPPLVSVAISHFAFGLLQATACFIFAMGIAVAFPSSTPGHLPLRNSNRDPSPSSSRAKELNLSFLEIVHTTFLCGTGYYSITLMLPPSIQLLLATPFEE
ncbi:hypothetical protein STEG23_011337, partial [Scotinomys teguina]